MNELAVIQGPSSPIVTQASLGVLALIADAGDQAARRFLEFFAATIRDPNTRLAYYRVSPSLS